MMLRGWRGKGDLSCRLGGENVWHYVHFFCPIGLEFAWTGVEVSDEGSYGCCTTRLQKYCNSIINQTAIINHSIVYRQLSVGYD